MVYWIIMLVAVLLTIMWAIMFLKQLKSGLTRTGLHDKFTWGLYVQGFFYFSALASGMLICIAIVTLFEMKALRPLVDITAALSFSCFVVAGISLGADLGKPFRGIKILTGKNFTSPLTWDFYFLSLCIILNLVFLCGIIPPSGPLPTIWSLLSLMAALGYDMIHTLFFLSRVEAGFRSQPFLALDSLAHSLWGGMALITLTSLWMGMDPCYLIRLLLILTALTLMPLAGAYIAAVSSKRGGVHQKIIVSNATIFLILIAIHVISPHNAILLAVVSLLILLAVFLEKAHLIRYYQHSPTIPMPYSRYEEVPSYRPTAAEWMLTIGSLGVCVLISLAVIYFQSMALG